MIPCSTALFSRCHALKVPRSWPAKQRCAGHRLARMGQLASLSSAAELKLWSLKSPGPKTSPRCDHQPWPWQISSSWTPFHYMVLVEECCTQTSPCKKAAGSRRQPGPCYVLLSCSGLRIGPRGQSAKLRHAPLRAAPGHCWPGAPKVSTRVHRSLLSIGARLERPIATRAWADLHSRMAPWS